MSVFYKEGMVIEDIQRGYGTVQVTTPSGGQETGNKVGIHSWLDSVINVKDHGAIGDGVNNDKDNIQNIIREFRTLGGVGGVAQFGEGGVVYLPAGIFQIDAALLVESGNLNQNLRIVGAGKESTIIKMTGGDSLDAVQGTGSSGDVLYSLALENLGIQSSSTDSHGIRLDTAENCVIHNCQIYNVGDSGIYVTDAVKSLTISECKIWNENSSDYYSLTSHGIEIESSTATMVRILNNEIAGFNYGIDVGGPSNGVLIQGNYIHDSVAGVRCQSQDSAAGLVEGVAIIGNNFEGNGEDIVLDADGSTYFTGGGVISGNRFYGCTGRQKAYGEGTAQAGGVASVMLRRAESFYIHGNTWVGQTSGDVDNCLHLNTNSRNNVAFPNFYQSAGNNANTITTTTDDGTGNSLS